MDSDFLDAHGRHWDDAERLFEEPPRLANADHLYGMAAECGLKRLMVAFGMELGQDGKPPSEDKKHVNKLWPRYDAYRSGHLQGTDFALPAANPFFDWDVNQRYANQAFFDASRVEVHRTGALLVYELIKQAKAMGLL